MFQFSFLYFLETNKINREVVHVSLSYHIAQISDLLMFLLMEYVCSAELFRAICTVTSSVGVVFP